jgi:fatty acyl-CoA reductase
MSSIQDFYRDQTIFLTGATGFLGKLILEKLLRTCAVQKVYILVRPKHDKTLQQRFHSIFDSAVSNLELIKNHLDQDFSTNPPLHFFKCFDLLRSSEPDFGKRVSLLSGDCSQRFLGLSEEARRLIKEEVTCIIHAAANVRFDTDLRTAVYTNVRSVKDLLELLGEVEKLRAFVYVSTAFSHCFRRTVAEEFYKVDDKPDKLLQMVEIMDDRMLNVMTPQ